MKKFTFLTITKDIRKAQAQFMSRLRTDSDERVDGTVAYRGGTYKSKIFNFIEHGFWAGGDSLVTGKVKHFWNCFGLGVMRAGETKNIRCEINPPLSGVTGQCGGAFIADGKGRVAIASRGRIGGGKKGVSKSSFEKHYRGTWTKVRHGDKIHKLVFIDYLDGPALPARLGDYVLAVAKIKGKITGSGDSDTATEALLANAAATGNTSGLTKGQKEGLKKLKKSWVYERSSKNRRIALALWGNACCVCGLRFDEQYGKKLAGGFIEFHHLHPVAMGPRKTDPAKDLRPLCSNCHSMAHKRRPNPVPIGTLRNLFS